jgi:cytidine deaminase
MFGGNFMDYSGLIKSAISAKQNSYAPYSNFHVGAAVLTEDGSIFSGCNVENAAFGATNCAERSAIFTAISAGKRNIQAIVIISDLEDYTFPCGICRQVISEFADSNIKIILAKNENDYIVKTLEEILPGAFSKKDLNK